MSQHGVHADILKREALSGGPREHFQTSDANDFASAKETAQSTFSDRRQAQEPGSFGQAERFNASEMEGSQKQATLTERLQGKLARRDKSISAHNYCRRRSAGCFHSDWQPEPGEGWAASSAGKSRCTEGFAGSDPN